MENRGKFLIEQGLLMYIGNMRYESLHKHSTMHLLIHLEGNIEYNIKGIKFTNKCVIINSNVMHYYNIPNGKVICFLIDKNSRCGQHLNKICTSFYYTFNLDSVLKQIFVKEISKETPQLSSIKKIINKMFNINTPYLKPDDRLEALLYKINKSDLENVDITKLTKDIPISDSRLRHIFKEYMYMSIKRYILWTKFIKAYQYCYNSKKLNNIAHYSGFSDYSHLSKMVKEVFGTNLKEMIELTIKIKNINPI